MTKPIPHDLLAAIRYEPETGNFYWLKPRIGRSLVTPAGTNNAHGYRIISFNGKAHKAHRLAWLVCFGSWPTGEIDHINGLKGDNRICNLRLASKPENAQNQAPQSRAKSSRYKGVHWRTERSKWVAMITVNGRKMRVGSFFDEASAAQAYNAAARRFYGPFARLNDV